jgi:cellulose synthase operon protein C
MQESTREARKNPQEASGLPLFIRRTLAAALVAGVLAACSQSSPEKSIASGKAYLAKGDYNAAAIEFKNALQQQPDNGEGRFLLGTALAEQGDAVAAEAELRRALQYKHPEDIVIPPLARAMSDAGQAKKMLGEFGNKQLSTADAQAELKAVIGLAHLQQGEIDAAARAFAAARTAKPDHLIAQLGEARVTAVRGDLPAAAKAVEAVLAKAPGDIEALALKGELAMAQRQFDAAASAFAQVVQKRPSAGSAWFSLVISLAEQQKVDEAKQRLDGFKKAVPRDPRASYLQAWMSMREGNKAAARDSILQVLKVAPDHVPTLALAGLIESENGNYVQAEEHLRRVLERVPQHFAAAQTLVGVHLRARQPGKALERLQPLLKARPNDPAILALAGEVYLANNRVAEARKYFEASTAGDASNPRTQMRLGEIYLATRDDERAMKALQSAEALDPKSDRPDLALIASSLQRREFDKALAAIDVLEKKRPDNPLPHNLRGSAYLGKNDRAKARASFERALAVEPAYFPAALNLAGLDLREGKRDDARKRFERVLEKDAKNSRASIALADVMIAEGRPTAEVVGVLERGVKANPSAPEAHTALIAYHLRSRDPRAAVTAALGAAAALPESPQMLELLGVSQQAAGEINQAITSFQKLAKQIPNAAGPLVRLAGAYTANKDYAGAVRELRRALELEPGNLDITRELASVFVLQGSPDAAVREARAVQERDPKSAAGHVLEGDIYAAQKQWAEAERAYARGQKVVAAPGIAIRRVAVLDASGKRAEADAAGAAWMKEQPKDVVVRTFLAERALGQKDYKQAATLYQSALALQPENALLLNNYAWSIGRLGDPRALEFAERATQLQPEAAPILDTYGMLLAERGQVDRGLEMMTRAVQFGPMLSEVRLNYARVLAKAGKKPEARKEAEAALKLPDAARIKADAEAFLKSL